MTTIVSPADIAIIIHNILLDNASEYVYDGMPNNLPEKAKAVIVYEVGFVRPMHDTESGQAKRGFVAINCYHKNKANGVKNTSGIQQLIVAVDEAIKDSTQTSLRLSLSSIESPARKMADYQGQTIIYNIFKK